MKIAAPPPLKPLDLSGRGSPAVSTRLSPTDLSGIISHPKTTATHGPLASGATPNGSDVNGAAVSGVPAPQADTPDAHHDRLVRQAQQWVGQTFFGVLLKQMRESPFKSHLFEGGRGGQAFSSLYDQKLIEHMSRGAGKSLVNAIVRK